MKIPVARKQFESNGRRLRRARRLYARLIWRELLRNPDMAFICAQRALSRGLYSPNTGLPHVVFSLVRKTFQYHAKTLPHHINWHQWLRENQHANWHKFGRYNYPIKFSKPRLRIVA